LLQVDLTFLDLQLHHLHVVRKDDERLDRVRLIDPCLSEVDSDLVQKFVAQRIGNADIGYQNCVQRQHFGLDILLGFALKEDRGFKLLS